MGRLQDFIFPAYDVRFIAINDDVDSAKGENDFAVFKNVFNDYYAKDTSKKIRAVVKMRGEAGGASRQQSTLWVHKRSAGQEEMDCRRRSGKGGAAHLQPLHCGERPHADCQNPHSRQGADRYCLSRQAKGLGHAGESLSVVRQICRRNIGASGVHRLYRELQDLYQVLKFKKRMENPVENSEFLRTLSPPSLRMDSGNGYRNCGRTNAGRQKQEGQACSPACSTAPIVGPSCTSAPCNTYKDDSQNHFVCSNYKSNTGSCKIHYIREQVLYRIVLETIRQTLSYVRMFRKDFQTGDAGAGRRKPQGRTGGKAESPLRGEEADGGFWTGLSAHL